MLPRAKLFVGFKPEGRLRHVYESKSDDTYVGEEGAGKLLTRFDVDGHTYLGKIVDGGLSTERVDDVARHVLSILRRLLSGERLPTALSIFAVVD